MIKSSRRVRAARHRLEALALKACISLSRALGPVIASNLGATIMRVVGPRLGASQTADTNLRLAMPELSEADRTAVIRGVWDNLGRTAAELPHLGALECSARGPGWEISGSDHLRAVLARGGPAIFFSAHFANWELIGPATAACGIHMGGFYRAASNENADQIIRALRRDARGGDDVPMFAKGATGGREAMAHLAAGGFLGVMMDQKMDDGIAVDFFGRPAMTAPALARFALRFGCPVIPIHVERLGPARLRVVCEPPVPPPATSDRSLYIHAMTGAINRTIESWIRAQPQSWLWLHRRWPSGLAAAHIRSGNDVSRSPPR
jgi:KDO2-lipid IV(A) lauroyltransferase